MKIRGDLSAPVLAILVTIGVIVAGLVLLAWFWWFAPTAGHAGSLQILGQPAIDNSTKTAYISVKNTGNAPITIEGVVVKGQQCTFTQLQLQPGESKTITVNCTRVTIDLNERVVNGIIHTDYGVYTVSLVVV